jgi:hypothetical protein
MAKSDLGFDPAMYAPVAERIRLFWESFPNGRITTRLVSRTEREVVFEARVYRSAEEAKPAATGWAAEREGDGDVNVVACLENTETSAVGRALANLGFTAARERPSLEEMQKAAWARARLGRMGRTPPAPVVIAADTRETRDARQSHANVVGDLLRLVEQAARSGVRARRAQRWRTTLLSRPIPAELLTTYECRLRAWIARHPAGGA